MVNQRLIFLVCLASITLFSFHCSGTSADPSHQPVTTNNGSSNETIPVNPSPPPPTTQAPNTTTSTEKPTSSPITTPTTKPTDPTTKPTPAPSPTSSSTSPSTSTLPPSSTSEAPKPNVTTVSPNPKPNPHDRSFDLPSFIGGVILALGVAAISYVVYKFYKTRSDPNYRSL